MQPHDNDIEKVYDSIAEDWHNKRQKPTLIDPDKYASSWPKGKLLDIGCGLANCTAEFAKKGFDCVGVDVSKQQLTWAKKYLAKNGVNFPLIKANCLDLPFKDNTFDYVISIAVFHHLDSDEKRLKAFREVYRVLKPNGTALVTCWNKTQPRFILGSGDRYVKWSHKARNHYRYYHLFTYWEMRRLAEKAGFKIVKLFAEESYKLPFKMFSKNVCAILKKQI